MSYQYNVSFVGETSIVFLETWVNCKVFSISTVILPYYLVHLTVHCYFETWMQIVSCQINISFVGETCIIFSETWVNYKVLSILTMILSCYLVHQTSIIITFILKIKLWVANSMWVVLVKHILFFRDIGKLQSVVNFDCDFTMLPDAPDVHYYYYFHT